MHWNYDHVVRCSHYNLERIYVIGILHAPAAIKKRTNSGQQIHLRVLFSLLQINMAGSAKTHIMLMPYWRKTYS